MTQWSYSVHYLTITSDYVVGLSMRRSNVEELYRRYTSNIRTIDVSTKLPRSDCPIRSFRSDICNYASKESHPLTPCVKRSRTKPINETFSKQTEITLTAENSEAWDKLFGIVDNVLSMEPFKCSLNELKLQYICKSPLQLTKSGRKVSALLETISKRKPLFRAEGETALSNSVNQSDDSQCSILQNQMNYPEKQQLKDVPIEDTNNFIILSSQLNRTMENPHKEDGHVRFVHQILEQTEKDEDLEREPPATPDSPLKKRWDEIPQNSTTSFESGYVSQSGISETNVSCDETESLIGSQDYGKRVKGDQLSECLENTFQTQLKHTILKLSSNKLGYEETKDEQVDMKRQAKIEELKRRPFYIWIDGGRKLDFSDLADPGLPDGLVQTEDIGRNRLNEKSGIPPPPPPLIGWRHPPITQANTLRLHWADTKKKMISKEVNKSTIWNCIKPIAIDKKVIQNLFRIKEMDNSKVVKDTSKKCVLPEKRAHVLNIELTRFPRTELIKCAILKMDNKILSKDNIEQMTKKMMPTTEELDLVKGLKEGDPNMQLGTAEEFIYCLSTIPNLKERLEVWHFILEFPNVKNELAEAFHEFKLGMLQLQKSQTFKNILAVILSIGNILNVRKSEGFNLMYLVKLIDVKDTQNHQTLVHHVCEILHQRYGTATTNFYSEIPSIIRSRSTKWKSVASRLADMEVRCSAAIKWDSIITDHPLSRQKIEILHQSYEQILQLHIVYERLILRFDHFLHFFTFLSDEPTPVKLDKFCKVINDFSLEFQTSWELLLTSKRKKDKDVVEKRTIEAKRKESSEQNNGYLSDHPELLQILSENSKNDYGQVRRRKLSIKTDTCGFGKSLDLQVRRFNSKSLLSKSFEYDCTPGKKFDTY